MRGRWSLAKIWVAVVALIAELALLDVARRRAGVGVDRQAIADW